MKVLKSLGITLVLKFIIYTLTLNKQDLEVVCLKVAIVNCFSTMPQPRHTDETF